MAETASNVKLNLGLGLGAAPSVRGDANLLWTGGKELVIMFGIKILRRPIMISINPYINFNGNCMEAFEFYKKVFGGEFTYVGRYKDMPMEDGKQMPEELKEMIMHIGLPINEHTTLCGSDVSEAFGQKAVLGGNVELMIGLSSKEEVDALWAKLVDGATIGMPPEVAFWGDYFGSLTDKFGTKWMLICSAE